MLTYPWHRAEIMRNTPDFTPKSAQNAYKQKITVADIVSTTVTDLVAGAGLIYYQESCCGLAWMKLLQ